MFTGALIAIVTPFRNGKVDERAFGDLIEWQIANGTNGIVPCGTTGESATLSHQEHHRVVELTVEVVNQRVPVIAGTGSNSTAEAVSLTKHAKQAGADGALLITPYYNKPTQEGLYRHYKVIAESVDLPQILYNIPGRTGVNMLPSTVARLCGLQSIVGIKEGSGSVQQASEIAHTCGDRMTVLAGDDALTLPMMAVGGKGVISVTSNIAPIRDGSIGQGLLEWTHRRGAPNSFRIVAAFQRALLRDQSDSGENCVRHDGKNRSGAAAAALCHGDRDEGPTHASPKGCRPHLVSPTVLARVLIL